MNRRDFLGGLAGILAAGVAPAAVGSSILMPVRKIVVPRMLDMVSASGVVTLTENQAFEQIAAAHEDFFGAYEWGQESVIVRGNENWSGAMPLTMVGNGSHAPNFSAFMQSAFTIPNRAERRRMLRAER